MAAWLPAPPPGLLESVAAVSRRLGSDPEFARGGGGNTSAKAEGVVWIKPSGVSLAGLTPDALMPLAMEPLFAMLRGEGEAGEGTAGSDPVLRVGMAARLRPSDDRRPSVECLFHALLPDPIVVHTHPTTVNALTCAARGDEVAAELFGDEALWIPYTDPGLQLARRIASGRAVFEARTGRPAPPVLLLGNHGLVVSGGSAEAVEERSRAVVAAVAERIGRLEAADGGGAGLSDAAAADVPGAGTPIEAVAAALAELLDKAARPRSVAFDGSPLARWIGSTGAGHAFLLGGPLTPDQIVYAGSWPLLVEALPESADDMRAVLSRALVEHRGATGAAPSVVVVAGMGVFAVGDTPALARTALDVELDAARIAIGARRLGGVRPLAPDERRFIEDWEAEAYRKGIAAGPAAER